MKWLTPFRECFGHEAQQIALGQYISGRLGDSARKSMQAMLARVTAPRYQSFQHFITDAPWDAEALWHVLRRARSRRWRISRGSRPTLRAQQTCPDAHIGSRRTYSSIQLSRCSVPTTGRSQDLVDIGVILRS